MPRFTLRTLFVVVTAFGLLLGWLSWQASIVRERQALRRQLMLEGASFREAGSGPVGDGLAELLIKLDSKIGGHIPLIHTRRGAELPRPPFREGDPTACPNWVRRMLGDRDWESIALGRIGTAPDLKRVACFPEADILAGETPFRSD